MSHNIGQTKAIPYTIMGGASSGSVDTLSGYTCKLTEFTYRVDQVPDDISNNKFIWNLGDGTTVTNISASHVYNWPGVYNVSLVGFNSAGVEHLSTVTKSISVSDILPTTLKYAADSVFNIRSVQAGALEGRDTDPIKIERLTSLQSYGSLSGSGYTLHLHASGSKSNKLNTKKFDKSKWAHIDQTWSFYNTVTANNGVVTYTPIDNVNTTNEEIYYRRQYVFNHDNLTHDQYFVRVPLSQKDSLSGTVLVGTSGTALFYYADDIPTAGTSPVLLSISYDTSQFRDLSHIISDQRNVNFMPLDWMETQKVILPVRVNSVGGDAISFTSTGIRNMPLSKNKWQMTQIPFFVNITDSDGVILENYPALSINPYVPGEAYDTTTSTVNLSVLNSNDVSLSAHFHNVIDNQLPPALSGMYRGVMVCRDAAPDAQLKGSGVFDSPPSFIKDNNIVWIANSEFGELYRIIPTYIEYNTDRYSGDIRSTIGIKTQHSGVSDTLPIATAPISDKTGRDETITHVVDSSVDELSSFNTYGELISTIDFSQVTVSSLANIGIQDLRIFSSGNEFNLAPSSIAMDSNRDYWITLYDAATIVKFSSLSASTVTSIIQHNDNINVPDAQTSTDNFTNNGLGGYNTIEPAICDTDTNDNVWVAYSNPLSASIRKFSSTGDHILQYNFPEGVTPQDMVVDNKDNVWVATVNQFRQPREVVNEYIYAQNMNEGFSYYVGTVSFNGNTSLASWQIGEIVESQWNIHDKNFNGKFIISDINLTGDLRWKVDVLPYTGRVAQTNMAATSSTQMKVYPSDKVYKFDSTGTLVYEVSGFLKPGHIVVDGMQHPWILHDTNTLTQIDTNTGLIVTSTRVETSDFIDNVTPSFDMATFDEGQLKGIGCDTTGNILAINTFENKLFIYDNISSTPRTIYINDNPPRDSMRYRAFSDWSGFRWLNKYHNKGGRTTLEGSTTFNILPSGGKYKIAKINEGFDPIETIKSYRFQPMLIGKDRFFDDMLGSIVGTVSGDPTELGKSIYEKISNFSRNTTDPDTCNINALYSIAEHTGTQMSNYNFPYIGGLQRIMNIVSVPHHRLWGTRSKFDRDFNKQGTTSALVGINLGDELNASTYIVSAGTPIVAEQLFNREFKTINTMYVSGTEVDPGYVASIKMLSSYPLSSYNANWNWGLHNAEQGADIFAYYNFHEYTVNYNDTQIEGLIDWANPYTNISESLSSIDDWHAQHGPVDTMIDYELRRGLGLFESTLSASTP